MPLTQTAPVSAASEIKPQPVSGPTRVVSVDALRGFDMFWIIGADALFASLDKLAGSNPVLGAVATQLDHVAWAGFRFYDLIFPLFVFIVGVSLVFSLTRRISEVGKPAASAQICRRFIILYLLGTFAYGGIAAGWDQVRLLGVLQRIALCYLFAGLAFTWLKPKALVVLCASLLVGYWALLTFVPVPEFGAGNFEEGKNLANYIDKQYLPLRKWDGDHDPEGLLSTLPAIASALLGVFAGLLLQNPNMDGRKKVQTLFTFGIAGVVLGFLWSMQFPIIKKIWTSSFVLVAAGFSALLLGTFYLIVDVWKKQKWATPFIWIGTNAITIYMLVHIVKMTDMASRFVGGDIRAWLNASIRPGLGDFLVACVALALSLWFVRFLYNRRIFLRV